MSENGPVIELSRKETRSTSRECSVCESLTRKEHCITMICEECGLIIDRDINAAINIAKRGRARLIRSFHEMEKG
ncbi:MAG: zinc ribbon domain-containing protein [Thermoplasmata archaeon]